MSIPEFEFFKNIRVYKLIWAAPPPSLKTKYNKKINFIMRYIYYFYKKKYWFHTTFISEL